MEHLLGIMRKGMPVGSLRIAIRLLSRWPAWFRNGAAGLDRHTGWM